MIEKPEMFNEKSFHLIELCGPLIGPRNLSDGTFVLIKTIGAFTERGLRIENREGLAFHPLSSILNPQDKVWI